MTKKPALGALVIGIKPKAPMGSQPPEKEGNDPKLLAADAVLSAIENKDKAALAEALTSFYSCCSGDGDSD